MTRLMGNRDERRRWTGLRRIAIAVTRSPPLAMRCAPGTARRAVPMTHWRATVGRSARRCRKVRSARGWGPEPSPGRDQCGPSQDLRPVPYAISWTHNGEVLAVLPFPARGRPAVREARKTLTRYTIESEHRHPGSTGEFSGLLNAVATAVKIISNQVSRGALASCRRKVRSARGRGPEPSPGRDRCGPGQDLRPVPYAISWTHNGEVLASVAISGERQASRARGA